MATIAAADPGATWLVGDIGATNARFGLVSPDGTVLHSQTFPDTEFPSIEDAIHAFLAQRGEYPMPREGALAIAAPVTGDQIRMTNHPWRFSIAGLRDQLGFDRLEMLNDFTAAALALPLLADGDRMPVGGGMPVEGTPIGVLGPGSGLGVSGLIPSGAGWRALTGEGGHATMAPSTERLLLSHLGCHAALPALGAVVDFVRVHRRPAVLLCLELSSLHLQEESADAEQAIVHALFSDAAAALVVEPGDQSTRGLEVLDAATVTIGAAADLMTWVITDHGFRMGLSRRVPDLIAEHVGELVETLLSANGLTIAEVQGWAVHPGGPRVLERIGAALDLPPDALEVSSAVLAGHGNCSSATLLVVLEELQRAQRFAPGAPVVALTFGPGLSICATLLRAR